MLGSFQATWLIPNLTGHCRHLCRLFGCWHKHFLFNVKVVVAAVVNIALASAHPPLGNRRLLYTLLWQLCGNNRAQTPARASGMLSQVRLCLREHTDAHRHTHTKQPASWLMRPLGE